MKRPLALVLLSVVWLMLPGVASAARPRVALIKFDGDPGGAVQDLVSEALDADTLVVGPKEVNRTVDKLGLSEDMSEKELKKLASELDADALVQGKIGKKGDNRIAHFKVFVHGKKKGFSVEFSNLKSDKLKQTLHDKMLEKISGISGSDDGDKKAAKKKKGGDDDDADARPKKKKLADDDAGDDPLAGDKKAAKKKKGGDDEEAALKKKSDKAEEAGDKGDKADKGDKTDSGDKASDGDDPDAKAKKKHDDAAADDEDAPRKGKKRTAHSGDDDSSDDEIHKRSDEERPQASLRSANRAALRLDVGGSVTTRTLKFTSRSFDQAPKGYANSPVPGVRLAVAIYPFALGNPRGALAGIGLVGDYDKTMSLSLQSSVQPGTKFAVNENHWSVGVRYRVPFGSTATSPTLTIGGSYATRTFKVNPAGLDAGKMIDLPDVGYKGYLVGGELRVPLASSVALFVGGAAYFVTAAGDIQTNAQYGQAKVTAGEGSAGLDVVFGTHYGLRLSGDFAQLGYAFTGSGMMTNNRDGDPTTPDVGGAADRYIGGALTLVVLY